MTVQIGTMRSSESETYTSDISKLYLEGIVAGTIGAATIAILLLIWDTIVHALRARNCSVWPRRGTLLA